jgi:hypothetical protein
MSEPTPTPEKKPAEAKKEGTSGGGRQRQQRGRSQTLSSSVTSGYRLTPIFRAPLHYACHETITQQNYAITAVWKAILPGTARILGSKVKTDRKLTKLEPNTGKAVQHHETTCPTPPAVVSLCDEFRMNPVPIRLSLSLNKTLLQLW